jgi:hypothetical protein
MWLIAGLLAVVAVVALSSKKSDSAPLKWLFLKDPWEDPRIKKQFTQAMINNRSVSAKDLDAMKPGRQVTALMTVESGTTPFMGVFRVVEFSPNPEKTGIDREFIAEYIVGSEWDFSVPGNEYHWPEHRYEGAHPKVGEGFIMTGHDIFLTKWGKTPGGEIEEVSS